MQARANTGGLRGGVYLYPQTPTHTVTPNITVPVSKNRHVSLGPDLPAMLIPRFTNSLAPGRKFCKISQVLTRKQECARHLNDVKVRLHMCVRIGHLTRTHVQVSTYGKAIKIPCVI